MGDGGKEGTRLTKAGPSSKTGSPKEERSEKEHDSSKKSNCFRRPKKTGGEFLGAVRGDSILKIGFMEKKRNPARSPRIKIVTRPGKGPGSRL